MCLFSHFLPSVYLTVFVVCWYEGPSQVVSVNVVSSTDKSITIHWFRPNVTNGRIVQYEVTSGMANTTQGDELPMYLISVQTWSFNGSTVRYKITGLQPSTRYAVFVSATTEAGSGPVSRVAFAITQGNSRCACGITVLQLFAFLQRQHLNQRVT